MKKVDESKIQFFVPYVRDVGEGKTKIGFETLAEISYVPEEGDEINYQQQLSLLAVKYALRMLSYALSEPTEREKIQYGKVKVPKSKSSDT